MTFARTLDDNTFFRSLTIELFFYSCVERGVDHTFEWIIAMVLQKTVKFTIDFSQGTCLVMCLRYIVGT